MNSSGSWPQSSLSTSLLQLVRSFSISRPAPSPPPSSFFFPLSSLPLSVSLCLCLSQGLGASSDSESRAAEFLSQEATRPAATNYVWGTHFTCFTGTKIHILTLLLLLADLEMQRLTVKEKRKRRASEDDSCARLLSTSLFSPLLSWPS